jgi:hypothetical protein
VFRSFIFFGFKRFTLMETALKAEHPQLVPLHSFFLCFGFSYGAFNIHEVWKNKHPRLFPPNGNVMVSSPRENSG